MGECPQQDGYTDCGLFAIGVYVALVNKQQPGPFIQGKMREHLVSCLENLFFFSVSLDFITIYYITVRFNLRSGEATLTSGQEFDPEADLSEGDIALDDLVNPTVIRVHIKASRTDPFRQGVFVYLGATGNDLCPVAAVSAYLAIRAREPGPFFRFASGAALTREALVEQLRSALSQFDMDVSPYSGHSFRIGAATTAAAVGLEDSLIKTLGCWQSVAYQLYVRLPRERLASVSKRLSEA